MRFRLIGLSLAAITCISGCATAPGTASSDVAMIMWPRTEAGCDFEHPDRDIARAISTSPTETAILQRRGRSAAGTTYVVRNTQLMFIPAAGDRLCLTVMRGLTLGEKDAVFGFDVHFTSGAEAEISPAYARLSRLANRSRPPAIVRIAFGSGLLIGGRVEPAGFVDFDLGSVGSSSGPRQSPVSRVLPLPTGRPGGLTRLAAAVEETPPGTASMLSRMLIDDTLNQADSWN